jgi:hypothetical protein
MGTTSGFFSNCLPAHKADKQNGWRYKLVSSSFQLRAAPHSFVSGFDSGNVSTLHVGLSQTVQDRAGLRWCLRIS